MTVPRRPFPNSTDQPADFEPDWAKPPGEIILTELKARGLTQAEFAVRTSLSAKHINQLIKGITTLSPEVAVALERTLDIPVDFWLKAEARWRSRQIRVNSRARLTEYADWFEKFPQPVLIAQRLISHADSLEVRVEKLLRFFGVTDTEAFNTVWLRRQVNFKRSQRFDVDPYATALWVRLAERAAESRAPQANKYDQRRLRAVLPSIPPLTRSSMPEAFLAIRKELESAGVLLVYMPEIADTRICGASRWLQTGHPIIALTNRNKRIDSFWFYLAHEIGHILLHPGRETFIDQLDKSLDDDKDELETAADSFAQRFYIPESEQPRLNHMSVGELEYFADELKVAPSIVAGQYGRLHNKWAAVSKMRPTIRLDAMLSDL
ncbi:ImmA/IrrE family metallo-endopeptidase [Mycobacterium sp. GA-2829]|uniref:ImmA/IrrE family metallo-endopeptidase n=1 Tax=Mycobacterium sp. GA-2829 TaxID=1772283 RepID=UPI000ACE1C0C|nr:ImmA/IrrE family metallo-endopeptidase [Mycobacterium sp. GA-2829]